MLLNIFLCRKISQLIHVSIIPAVLFAAVFLYERNEFVCRELAGYYRPDFFRQVLSRNYFGIGFQELVSQQFFTSNTIGKNSMIPFVSILVYIRLNVCNRQICCKIFPIQHFMPWHVIQCCQINRLTNTFCEQSFVPSF